MLDNYCLDRSRQRLTLQGMTYTAAEVQTLTTHASPTTDPFRLDLYAFLRDWFSESDEITVHTSGSTGTPKVLTVQKKQMMQSAQLTCSFLNLHEGEKALLCMPLQYIAGKMMVVRALVAGLDLILATPSGHPLKEVETPLRFAAMIPLQVYNTLHIPEERARMNHIDYLIIGGGAVDPALEKEIQTLSGAVFATYGMTETLSHIALRRLNGTEASPHYIPFPSVRLSLDTDDALVIDAPLVSTERLQTNDLAHLYPDGSFTLLGRKDNIINSGGIKIQTESIEEALRPLILTRFAITAVPHPQLGEAMVLLMEPSDSDDALGEPCNVALRERISALLAKHHQPKHICVVPSLPLTGSGKIDRAGCRKLAVQTLHSHNT